jgi:hypothetical protein
MPFKRFPRLSTAVLALSVVTFNFVLADNAMRTFELSGVYNSSYPAVLYKSAFEADLNFSSRTCYQALTGRMEVTAFSAGSIAYQCANNLEKLDSYRGYALNYINRACIKSTELSKYFTEESKLALCGGFLRGIYLEELEQNYKEFSDFRQRLLEFSEKCRRRTGDADGC